MGTDPRHLSTVDKPFRAREAKSAEIYRENYHLRGFKLKGERLTKPITGFKISEEAYYKVKKMADSKGITYADVIRQMVDYSLESMQ